ncbi:MAG: hypothetical protein SFZ23_05155 [Planctomycetota bacterium]|nr:hypothetical protein [Planctomycetota bacterium]
MIRWRQWMELSASDVILIGIGAAGLLVYLHTLAASIRNQSYIIELKYRVKILRAEYERRMAEIESRRGGNADVEIVADSGQQAAKPAAQAAPRKAA